MESAAAALSMLESRVEFEQMSNAAVLSLFFFLFGFCEFGGITKTEQPILIFFEYD